ncbi:endonuclease [Shewanella sp. VB17]|uniref:endonuclease n=1 Tax=Shewanella sp. VB17 TaxID=2739432 RepID=UPI0015671CF0|nr:endonuclease [Shewanella sp. VB17]NRD74943.1 endonuclease [Shewanella sp. VB17]
MKIFTLPLMLLLPVFAFNVNASVFMSEALYGTLNNDAVVENIERFNAGCTEVDLSQYRTTTNSTQFVADWPSIDKAVNQDSGLLTINCDDRKATGYDQLDNDQTKVNLSANTGQTLKYIADLPVGVTQVSVTMMGGRGDGDLYLRQGREPRLDTHDCASYLTGNNEQCLVTSPTAGRYYINIYAYEAFSDVSIVFQYLTEDDKTGPDKSHSEYDFATYYADAIGQSGAALKDRLNVIIKGHKQLSYREVWDGLGYADEDPANSNNVILLYTGRSEPKINRVGMSHSLDAWNREHVWAKSHGFPDSNMHAYTDMHHLRPADVTVNSSRGNKDFALGGSEISEAPGNYVDSDSFEPKDDIKGDVARMVFYMDIRYEGNDSSGTPNLTIANGITQVGQALLGDRCMLLRWHQQDPVSDWERRRNNRIFEWQKNRNPFIDNSAWVSDLYAQSCQ